MEDTQAIVNLQVSGAADVSLYVHDERDQVISQTLRTARVWEPYETSLLVRMLTPGDTFVDVGANIGYFSLLAARCVGAGGQVFAFEPDPDNAALFRASIVLNGFEQRIDLAEAGLSDSAQRGALYLSADNLGDHQIYAGAEARPSVPIELLRGSDYLQGKLNRIDLLKIDTQGSEFQVVNGLLPLLQRLPPALRIMLELTPYSLRQAGASGRELIELLGVLQQPMWIIDHIEHRLVSCPAEELARWCDNVDAIEGDQGFMNILVGPGLSD